jgi:hypothetical protein
MSRTILGTCNSTYPELCHELAYGYYELEPRDESLPKVYYLFCPKHQRIQQQYANASVNHQMSLPKEERIYKTIYDIE